MKVLIEIPKEFEEHFNNDKFEDSLERIRADIKVNLENETTQLSGRYEMELAEMLRDAMSKSEVVRQKEYEYSYRTRKGNKN